ncbi:MAG: hypothetical protein K6B41_10040 [Butyrivibrio sp.]|nr:hypothetical protein [Butyrivibrio sp.]
MNTSINTTGNNRFKKMRKQLILIVMFITLGIFLMVFGIVVAVLTVHYDNHSKNIVSLIEQYDGILPTPGEYKAEGIIPGYSMDFRLSVEDFRTIKYYSVSFDNNGQMNCINQNISDLESLMLPKLIEKIYSIDQEYGYFEGYYFHKNYSNN